MKKKHARRIIGLFLILIAFIILPTATIEDTFTTVPLILLFPKLYFYFLLPLAIILGIMGIMLVLGLHKVIIRLKNAL